MQKRRTVFDAFNEAFESNMSATTSYKQAYEKTDQAFQRDFGFSPYTGYDGFRVNRSRKIKGRKSK